MSYIDEYGVDHENFTVRDELEYQFKLKKEKDKNGVWNKIKDISQKISDAVAPYTPTYYAGYGAANVVNGYNTLKNMYDTYKSGGVEKVAKFYGEPSVNQAMIAAKNVQPLNISDVNKHQYVSCVGASGGPLAAAETLAGGVFKEFADTKNKLFNPQQRKAYGGVSGVFRDSYKDLKNDAYGIYKGITSDTDDDCKLLLPESIRNKY